MNRSFILLAIVIFLTTNTICLISKEKDSTLSKEILWAVRKGDLKGITKLYEKGANLNTTDENGNTLLILAAEKGYLEIAKFLIQHKVAVNTKNKHGRSALLATSSPDVGRLLLDNGAEIEARNNNGWTPLMYSAIRNNTKMIKFLVQKGAFMNAQDRSGRTALMMLMDKGDREAIEFLLKSGADPNIIDSRSNTALIGASSKGRLIIAAILIKHGADVSVKNTFGKTAKIIAYEKNYKDVAGFLGSLNIKEVLSGPAQVRINDSFLKSLINPDQLKHLLEYTEEVKTTIKAFKRGKEGFVTIRGSVMTDKMFSCTVVLKMHESPFFAFRYFQSVKIQFKDILKRKSFKHHKIGDESAAFFQNDMTVMLFFTVGNIFTQLTLIAPLQQLVKINNIAEMVAKQIQHPQQ
jgi:ankyrin repeat protein